MNNIYRRTPGIVLLHELDTTVWRTGILDEDTFLPAAFSLY